MIAIPFTNRWYKLREEQAVAEFTAYMGQVKKIDSFKNDFIGFLDGAETGILRLEDCQETLMRYSVQEEQQKEFDSFDAISEGGFNSLDYNAEGKFDGEKGQVACSATLGFRWNIGQNWPLDAGLKGVVDGICADSIEFRFFQEQQFYRNRHLDGRKEFSFISPSGKRVDLKSPGRLKEEWNYIGQFSSKIYAKQNVFVYAHNTRFDGPDRDTFSFYGGRRAA